MKALLPLLISLIFLVPQWSHGEELNAGFVQGLWYSSDVVFADTPTRIYVAFRNNTPNDLTGTIRFTDNDKRIGTSNVSALSGRLVEAWVDWTPTYGEHKLVVTLSNTETHVIGEGSKPATLTDVTIEETLSVDYDTDKDGVGNKIDTDDDNDEVSDTDEQSRGSDPLVPNPKAITSPPEKEVAEKEAEPQSEPSETVTPDTVSTSNDTERGLERFVPEGTTDTLLTNVTNKVTNAKQSLDTYRKERNEAPEETRVEEVISTPSITTSGASFDTATITRTQIASEKSFLSSFVSSIAHIFHNIGTFFLWVLSGALGHPAFMQIFFLLLILYIIYRLIRRAGRRPY